MRHLILLRHGKAVATAAAGDHARPLSKRGVAEAGAAGAALMQQVEPDFAIVSDAVRTRQTFERVAARIGHDIPHRIEPRLYGAEPATILDIIAEAPAHASNLLVVGHNPGMGELARALARKGSRSARAELAEHFPTSAFAILALAEAAWSTAAEGGRLETFYTVDSWPASKPSS
jgi:phosphohistidine phosphatase